VLSFFSLGLHASSGPSNDSGPSFTLSPAYLSLHLFIPLFPAPPWHGSLSLVLSSQTHGFNIALPASSPPAILCLVSFENLWVEEMQNL